MSEEPQSRWKQSLSGKCKWLAWFALFAVVLFAVSCVQAISSDYRGSFSALIAAAALVALVGAALVMLAIWFVRWLCCWRNFRRFLFGLACFATLIALFYAEENWRGQRAWEQYRRAWEAKGEKFGLASLAPPPVPDVQNFAMTPLLKPALDFSRTTNGIEWRDTNALARLNDLSLEAAMPTTTAKPPVLGKLESGTLADLEAWGNFYCGNTNYPQATLTNTAAEVVLAALGKYQAELTDLTEAAATRPQSRFPIEYDYEMPAAILLPHLAIMKKFCLMTHVRAVARLGLRQPVDAFADLQLGFRLSDSVRDEPILISHLVRIAMLNIDLQTVREGLARHAWNAVQLAAIEDYLSAVNLLAELKHTLRGERAFGVGCIEWARRQGLKFDMYQIDGDATPLARVANFMPRGWLYQNMLILSQMHQDFTLAAIDERNRRVVMDAVEAGAAAIVDLGRQRSHPYKTFVALLFPAINKAIINTARMQTYVDATRVACALERYRLTNGQFPEKLDALVPRFLAAIPNDVIDGQPLRYRMASDGGYVIYSIGWNRIDDQGELAWTKKETGSTVDPDNGDWVWQFPNHPTGL